MTVLTEEQLETMRAGLRDIVSERTAVWYESTGEDAERDKQDLLWIDNIDTVSDAADMLDSFGKDFSEFLYQWAHILDPKDGFKFEKYDDEHEDREFREYLARTYDLTDSAKSVLGIEGI